MKKTFYILILPILASVAVIGTWMFIEKRKSSPKAEEKKSQDVEQQKESPNFEKAEQRWGFAKEWDVSEVGKRVGLFGGFPLGMPFPPFRDYSNELDANNSFTWMGRKWQVEKEYVGIGVAGGMINNVKLIYLGEVVRAV